MSRRGSRVLFRALLAVAGCASLSAAAEPKAHHAQKAPKKKPPKPSGKHPPPAPSPAPPPKVASAPIASHAPTATIERLVLDNGLRVVISPDPRAPVVSIAVAYDVGSRDDERGATGLTRLLARAFGQGSANVLRGEHERLVLARGGDATASSGVDRMILADTAPAGELALLLWLEADRMKSPKLAPDAIEAQKRGLVAERERDDIDPVAAGRARLRELAFQAAFPLEHDPRGAIADLAALRPDAVRALYEARCAASTTVLAITGDFEIDHAVSLVHRFFDTAKKQDKPAHAALPVVPEQTSQRTATLEDPRARATTVLFGWPLPPLGTDDHDALEAAIDVLAGGPGARLAQRPSVDKPLAVSVAARFERQRGPDLATLEITVADEAARADAERAVEVEIEALAKAGPTDAELAAYRAHREAEAWADLADPRRRASLLATTELVSGDARTLLADVPRAAAVTREKVRAAVTRWLAPTRRTLVVVGPPRDASDAPVAAKPGPALASPPPKTPKPRGHK